MSKCDNYDTWIGLFQDETIQKQKKHTQEEEQEKQETAMLTRLMCWIAGFWAVATAVVFYTTNESAWMGIFYALIEVACLLYPVIQLVIHILERVRMRLDGELPPRRRRRKKKLLYLVPSTKLLLAALGINLIWEMCLVGTILCGINGRGFGVFIFCTLCLEVFPFMLYFFIIYRREKLFHDIEYYVKDRRHL